MDPSAERKWVCLLIELGEESISGVGGCAEMEVGSQGRTTMADDARRVWKQTWTEMREKSI